MASFLDFNGGVYINPEHITSVKPLYTENGQYVFRVSLVGGTHVDFMDQFDCGKLQHFLDEEKLVWQNDDPQKSSIPPYMKEALRGAVAPQVEDVVEIREFSPG